MVKFGDNKEEENILKGISIQKSYILHDELTSRIAKMNALQCTYLIAYSVGRLSVAENKPSDDIYRDLIYQADLIMKGK